MIRAKLALMKCMVMLSWGKERGRYSERGVLFSYWTWEHWSQNSISAPALYFHTWNNIGCAQHDTSQFVCRPANKRSLRGQYCAALCNSRFHPNDAILFVFLLKDRACMKGTHLFSYCLIALGTKTLSSPLCPICLFDCGRRPSAFLPFICKLHKWLVYSYFLFINTWIWCRDY